MNTDIHSKPPINQLPEAAKEMARQTADAAKEAAQRTATAAKDLTGAASDAAKDVQNAAKDMYQTMSSKVEEGMGLTKEYAQRAVDATKDAAHHASDAAKDMCHSVSEKAEETLVRSKEYVRENPVPVVLGALALGVALGWLIVTARREEPTFRERYVDDPLNTARDAIYAVLAPVAQRLHEGYDSARDGAGKAMDKMHDFNPSRAVDSWSGQLRRVGNNLKFW